MFYFAQRTDIFPYEVFSSIATRGYIHLPLFSCPYLKKNWTKSPGFRTESTVAFVLIMIGLFHLEINVSRCWYKSSGTNCGERFVYTGLVYPLTVSNEDRVSTRINHLKCELIDLKYGLK